MNDKPRCAWCLGDPLYLAYHDQEWGVPLHDDRGLFEFLVLETFQAGLSWLTILKKRDNFRRAFAGFDPQRVARFDERDRRRLLADAGIVRNRLKVDAAIANARVFLEVQAAHGSFDRWIWSFTDGRPIVNRWRELREMPAQTPLAATISREMRRLGFRFAGPVVVYSHMQATGMVNDHLVSCYRHAEIRRLAAATTI
ncbi:MAG TPA: DNA-3-methyladenine glycosylase I [Acidobacteriota bacterium]|nr:DNA-3-methyladenine glycosylase I [Acidobacteriota bacterium]